MPHVGNNENVYRKESINEGMNEGMDVYEKNE
jgi:hypothetical protein